MIQQHQQKRLIAAKLTSIFDEIHAAAASREMKVKE
jgi:hypothetical protein